VTHLLPERQASVEFVSRFLSGEVTDAQFLDELYNGSTLDVLRSWQDAPRWSGVDALTYLLEQDLSTLAGRLNTLRLLGLYLQAHGVEADLTAEATLQADYDLLLRAQPSWVDVPEPIATALLDETRELAGEDRRRALREAIIARFRTLHRHPEWLQDPRWPVVETEPCTFVGQLDISTLRHDTAALLCSSMNQLDRS
jgi:hypothetical protein